LQQLRQLDDFRRNPPRLIANVGSFAAMPAWIAARLMFSLVGADRIS
jgi:hypothetical protein